MPKDRDRKIEEAIVRAESAQQAALNALTMAQVLGSILESTLGLVVKIAPQTSQFKQRHLFSAAAALSAATAALATAATAAVALTATATSAAVVLAATATSAAVVLAATAISAAVVLAATAVSAAPAVPAISAAPAR
jgi:hypothetical protein